MCGSVELAGSRKETFVIAHRWHFFLFFLSKIGSEPHTKLVCIYRDPDMQAATLRMPQWSETEGCTEVSTDDKRSVDHWMKTMEAFQKTDQEILSRSNFSSKILRIVSENLNKLISARKDTFLKYGNCDWILDKCWLGKKQSCIAYSIRDICSFFMEAEWSDKSPHPVVHSSSVSQLQLTLLDLINLLLGRKGEVYIPGIKDILTNKDYKPSHSIKFNVLDLPIMYWQTFLQSCEKYSWWTKWWHQR